MTGVKKRISVVFIAVITAIAFMPLIGTQPAYADGVLPIVTVGYVNDDGSYYHIALNADNPYYINGAEEATADPEGANAYYDVVDGILTLDDYDGASIDVRSGFGDLKIVLKGENKISGQSQFGINVPGNLEITSEEGGMLSIDVGPFDENTYGICSDGNTSISGDADISVSAEATGASDMAVSISTGEYPLYGDLTITDTASVSAEAVSEVDSACGFLARKITIDTEYMVSYQGAGDQYSKAMRSTEELIAAEKCQISLETTGNDISSIVSDTSLLDQFQNNELRHVDSGTADGRVFFRYEPHEFNAVITKATPTTDGEVRTVCPVCGLDEFVGMIAKANGYKLSYTTTTYTGKAKKPTVKVTRADGDVLADSQYKVSYSSNTNAGKAKAIVTFRGEYYEGVKTIPFTIKKAANPIKVSGRTAIVKYTNVKKKAQTLKRAKVLTVKSNKGPTTYTKTSGNGKIIVAKKTGKVTVKKGLKKGTYKVRVKVKAAGNGNFKAKTKYATMKIRVK